MQQKNVPPAMIAVVIVVIVVLGVFAYRAAQPPAPTTSNPKTSGVDPKNPARPPVDEHANDWHPPKAQ